ncbi:hypothetical protein [Streptosporangium sp. KLBMP 9127]|nr:hypothetical protein [Streptosporangium sp. KLBMP 9127]
MRDLEDALSRALDRQASRAPTAAPDFLNQVRARHSRRRRRGVTVAAAAAVAVVTAGAALATGRLAPPDGEPAARPTEQPVIDPAMPPIEKVWPRAVHTVPPRLPNGRRFDPQLFLNDHTVLVLTRKGDHVDRPDGLWAYDLDAGRAARLVTIEAPPGTVVTAPFVVAGDGRLAWWTLRKDGSRKIVDIWTAPITGGPQRKLVSFDEDQGIDLVIAGRKAIWSRWKTGGVYQMSLNGGRSKPLPGTTGHRLLDWPWTAPYLPEKEKNVVRRFGTAYNAETGERREMMSEDRGWNCGLTWCLLGRSAQHRDGSAGRTMPGRSMNTPALDRFLTLFQMGKKGLSGMVLYDLSTGRAGDLGIRPTRKGTLRGEHVDRRATVFHYESQGKKVIVDLASIK